MLDWLLGGLFVVTMFFWWPIALSIAVLYFLVGLSSCFLIR